MINATPTCVAVLGQPQSDWLDALLSQLPPDTELVVLDARAAMRDACDPGRTLVRIVANAQLPPYALARLNAAAALAGDRFDVISAADVADPALNPLPQAQPFAGDALALDAALWLLGERALRPCPAVIGALAWIGPDAALRLSSGRPLRHGVIDSLHVGTPGAVLRGAAEANAGVRQHAAPEPALAELRARMAIAPTLPSKWPGLDGRGVVLHVMHGWGGGVERFVRDLADGDSARVHLALIARGQFERRHYGESLELALVHHDRLWPLAQFDLAEPIASCAIDSAEWRELFAQIRARFAVSQVIVSSLIGHAVAVLDTGLPTEYVCHDYFPLWPVLHADFGDSSADFTAAAIASALADATAPEFPFDERDARFWAQLRAHFIATALKRGVVLVAPSFGVRSNWQRIAPELAALRFEVISHGLRAFAPVTAPAQPDPARTRLRLVVVGRLNGGKGEHLLHAALAAGLGEHAELFLIGSGRVGHGFFGRSGVHVLLDYERDQLPQILASIAPDAALLPATVAESFSYALSELRALGVPVIATRLGAFAERITDGRDGLLVTPEAASIVGLCAALRVDAGVLAAIRAELATQSSHSVGDMASAHRALLTPNRARVEWQTPAQGSAAVLAARALAAERERDQLRVSDADKDRELLQRGEWAQSLERERQRIVVAAQEEAQRLRAEIDSAHGHFAKLQLDFELRTEWARSLDEEVQQLGQAFQSAQQEWAQAATHFHSEVERLENQHAQMRDSLSWRLTRPLRVARLGLSNLRVRAGYLAQRALGLPPRVLRSLRARGLAGTFSRIRGGAGGAPMPLDLPAPDLIAAATAGSAFVPFALPEVEAPRASIVIPVYNKWTYTEACLRSLLRETQRSAFEVIVVDDGSADETGERLAEIGGVVAHRNAQNLGFVGSCNAGAALARGEYIVFLNNDTQVSAEWLDRLLDTFDRHPRVGLVGAKLVYPDGRLQEAGGIVFNDGSGWNYGRFSDPRDPAFNYVREVDYCSGAAIAIPRALFERLGGFDARYAPAYYEDTDLAFKVRAARLRVMYQPASTVFHFEGITAGTDTGSGTKKYQVINQQKFLERWNEDLGWQPAPGTAITLAREHRVGRRVLIVDATTPHPDEDSGSVRLVNLMQLLIGLGDKVSFFAENRLFDGRYTEALQQLGVEVLYHPWMPEPMRWLRENGRELDAVILSRHYVATPLIAAIRHYAQQARLVFDTVDLHYLREEREAALGARDDLRRTAANTKLAELRLVRQCDVTLVVSPIEQQLLQREVPGARIEVLSNVHQIAGRRAGFSERKDLFFVGGFQHQPNIDAMLWFVLEIWPKIARELPDAKFHIAGSRMPEVIEALASERVIVHGFLPSLDDLLDGCRLSVAPLRYGAGVKGKVNQSMAHGQPVVATTIAAEGMYLQHEIDVLVADDSSGFAREVVRLYSDEALWTKLAEAGLANIATHFSFEAATEAIKRVLG